MKLTLHVVLLAAMVQPLSVQSLQPLGVEALTNQIRISWPTIPGKFYDLLTAKQ